MQRLKYLIRITAIFLTLGSVSAISSAQPNIVPEEVHSLLLQGNEYLVLQRYSKADSIAELIIHLYPDHPAGYLFSLGVLQWEAMDFEELVPESSIRPWLLKAQDAIEKYQRDNPESLWNQFFLGSLYGYDSYARAQRGDWFGGFRKAISSTTEFENAIKKDSSFYDAYAGPGTYYYWKSRKTESIHWLPFVSDNREQGIAMLNIAIEKGVYNKFTAVSALLTILIDAERYDEAIRLAETYLTLYPKNRILLWSLASVYQKTNNSEKALVIYERLLETMKEDRPNIYNEIVCRINIIKIVRTLHLKKNIDIHVSKILSYKTHAFPPHLTERAKKHFDYLQEESTH